jgi:hypothetical protein
MPLIQIPKRQFFIVPEPDELEEEEHDFFQDWMEMQKESIDATDQDASDFGSDPYPYYRKVDHHGLSARLTRHTVSSDIASLMSSLTSFMRSTGASETNRSKISRRQEKKRTRFHPQS